MTEAVYRISLNIDGHFGSGSKARRHPPNRSAATIQHRLERLVPTAEPTLSSIEELLQFAFAEESANEVDVIAEPDDSDAELLATMDAAQDRAKAHLDERDDEHRNSRMYARE
jgi:hypothetical protein